MHQDSCPACARPCGTAGATTLLRCPGCGARFVGSSATSLELTLGSGSDDERLEAVLSLDPTFRERYRLGRLIGSGGMGMVIEATDVAHARTVAIKFLRRVEDDELLDRFQREVRLLASLAHPNVVQVLALDRIGHHPVLVMELLSGGTLKDRLTQRVKLPPAEAVGIMLHVVAGLEALHRRGVVHRDLKPENVLFSAEGTAKLADLGIAKDYSAATITAIGQVLGTPLYMSPEQARGEAPTLASDIYALGCMLYELLAGHPPFTARNPLELIHLHIEAEPPPLGALAPEVPERLVAVVHRCLAKRAADRPPGCDELAIRLKRSLGLIEAPSGTAIPAQPKPAQPAAAPPAPAPRREPPPPAAATHIALLNTEPDAVALTARSAPRAGPTWTCRIEPAHAENAPETTAVVGPSPTFVGRAPGPSEIVLDDPGVSYRHLLLIPDGDALELLDFKSTNGLKLNGKRVERGTLEDGDRVTLGIHTLTFRCTWPPDAASGETLLSDDLLASWIGTTGSLRDRVQLLLDELSARWRLARALVLAEHRATASFPVLASTPAGAFGLPDALQPGRLTAALELPEPRVDGVTALVPLRAGGRALGVLYLERGAGTPAALLTAAGQRPLAGIGAALALAIETAALGATGSHLEEVPAWRS